MSRVRFSAVRPDGTIHGDAHVGLFDILGFRAIVRNNSLAKLIQLFQKGERLQQLSAAAALVGGTPHLVSRFRPAPCEITHFSDSILLVSPDRGERGFVSIVTAGTFLVAAGLSVGIPLRGAITRGPVFVSADRKFHAGEAIVRAFELEQLQEWAGAIVDTSRIQVDSLKHLSAEVARDYLIRDYPVPMKSCDSTPNKCLNWARIFAAGRMFEAERRSIEDHMTQHTGDADERALLKIRNTRSFYKQVLQDMIAHENRDREKPIQDALELALAEA